VPIAFTLLHLVLEIVLLDFIGQQQQTVVFPVTRHVLLVMEDLLINVAPAKMFLEWLIICMEANVYQCAPLVIIPQAYFAINVQ
jgi:hypothetical protein